MDSRPTPAPHSTAMLKAVRPAWSLAPLRAGMDSEMVARAGNDPPQADKGTFIGHPPGFCGTGTEVSHAAAMQA